jgi:hypothetical protein
LVLSVFPQDCIVVVALAGTSGISIGSNVSAKRQYQYKPFQEYYQLRSGSEPDKATVEPLKKRELKTGHTEGSHSPFGLIWQIASATGWSVHHILWKIPYSTLMLMMNDAPHYVSADDLKKQNKKIGKKVKGQSALDFFQTKLANE